MQSKWKNIRIAVRLIWELDRELLVLILIASMTEAAIPLIAIVLSGYVLDSLREGKGIERLIFVFALVVALNMGIQSAKGKELYRLLDDHSLDKSYFIYYQHRGQE